MTAVADGEQLAESQDAVHVEDNHGQVAHTVYGGMHQTIVQTIRDALAYHELTQDYVDRCRATFTEPGFVAVDGAHPQTAGELFTILERSRLLVLVGSPGTGKHTAAIWLLSSLQGVRPSEIPYDPADGLDVASLPTDKRMAYLLEIADEAGMPAGFGRGLLQYAQRLADKGSYVVVTVSPRVWRAAGEGADGVAAQLGRPSPMDVLDRHLRHRLPDEDHAWWAGQPEVSSVLSGAWPPQVARFVDLVARTAPGPQRLRTVLGAYRNWEEVLCTWFAKHPDPVERTFLVAAATLEGARAGFVLQAAQDLAVETGDAEQSPGSLDGAGARQLADAVDATLVLDPDGVVASEYVRFDRPEYAQSVLDFVFSDRPRRFEEAYWRWMTGIPLSVRAGEASELAELLGDMTRSLALRRHDAGPLGVTAARWSARPNLRPVVVDMLTLAALSPELGREVRHRLYLWATRVSVANPLLLAVADVCAGEIADVFPDVALTRLRHLARRGDEGLREAVVAAVSRIWQRYPRRRRRLLDELTGWMRSADPAREAAGARAFVALLSQAEMPPFEAVRGSAAAAMAAALDTSDGDPLLADAVAAWLLSAEDDPTIAGSVIDLLTAAAEAEPRRTTRVVTLTRIAARCASAVGGRHTFADQLVERLLAADPLMSPRRTPASPIGANNGG